MQYNKMPRQVRLLIAIGLLMATLPMLFAEYVHIPDFLRGSMMGVGLGLEFTGLVKLAKIRKNSGWCKKSESEFTELKN